MAPYLQQPFQAPRQYFGAHNESLRGGATDFDLSSFIATEFTIWDELDDSAETIKRNETASRNPDVPLPPIRSPMVSTPLSTEVVVPQDSRSLAATTFKLPSLSKSLRQLLHQYRNRVCQLMMPAVVPSQNPWLQLYLSLALQEPATKSKQILLHAILAVSAFNQAELVTADPERYRAQGAQHSEEAARLLSKIIKSNGQRGPGVQDTVDKQALLAAALTMTTIEVIGDLSTHRRIYADESI